MLDSTTKLHKIPIIILFIWLGLTLFLFFFGPYDYKLKNAPYFITYLISVHLALYFGYKKGLKAEGKKMLSNFSYIKLTKWCIIITLFYTIANLIYTSGGSISQLGSALSDPAKAYEYSHDVTNISIFNYLAIFFAPITTIAVTCGIFYWKQISIKFRIILSLYVVFVIISSITAGIRSAMIWIILYVGSALLLSILHKKFKINFRYKILLSFSVIAFLFLFFSYTANLTKNRGGFTLVNPLTQEKPNENNILFKIFSPNSELTVSIVSFYLSHPYYRLNQAMDLPLNGIGFGLSNSYFLMTNIERITGWNGLEDFSYGLRLDKKTAHGNFGVYWSTFYTWIASDFTFPGTILVIYFIGYLFALSFKDTFISNNPFAIATFCNLFFTIYSFPTTNPLQDGNGITSILGLMIIWHLTRKFKFKFGNGTQS
jgi:hypothetical protein